MKGRWIFAGAVLLTAGIVLSACEDEEEFEITGPALEEVVAAAQSSPDLVRIDGRNEPWIFIDGVRQSGGLAGGHGDLDPRLIEKITVLKGTKAVELYGPDASVGVILITTKDTISNQDHPR